jgi:colicin import membrane protein
MKNGNCKKVNTRTIGSGDDAIVVNEADYEAGFPDDKELAKRVKALEEAEAEAEEAAEAEAAKAAKAKADKEAKAKAAAIAKAEKEAKAKATKEAKAASGK